MLGDHRIVQVGVRWPDEAREARVEGAQVGVAELEAEAVGDAAEELFVQHQRGRRGLQSERLRALMKFQRDHVDELTLLRKQRGVDLVVTVVAVTMDGCIGRVSPYRLVRKPPSAQCWPKVVCRVVRKTSPPAKLWCPQRINQL